MHFLMHRSISVSVSSYLNIKWTVNYFKLFPLEPNVWEMFKYVTEYIVVSRFEFYIQTTCLLNDVTYITSEGRLFIWNPFWTQMYYQWNTFWTQIHHIRCKYRRVYLSDVILDIYRTADVRPAVFLFWIQYQLGFWRIFKFTNAIFVV